MKPVFLIAMLAAFVGVASVGCSSDKPAQEPARIPAGGRVIPPWFAQIPSEPGKAFYGTGTGTYYSDAQMQNGINAADANAKNAIAGTMQTKVKSLLKQYMRQVLTPENEVHEESLTQSVLESLVNFTLRGCAIVKHEFDRSGDGRGWVVYSLSRIGFDDVAENLHAETSKAVARVQANAQHAFDELDKMIRDEQAKEGERPAPADMNLPAANKAGAGQ